MLLTIYKEIQIGFGKLLNQYKQKTDKIRNMNIFEKISGISEISRKLASLLVTSRNGDRKLIQSIRISSRPPMKKRKWN